MFHRNFNTVGTLANNLAEVSAVQLTDLGNGSFGAKLRCTDPTGQIFDMQIEYSWFAGLPEIDIEHVMINGDATHGMAFAAHHTDKLRAALTAAHHADNAIKATTPLTTRCCAPGQAAVASHETAQSCWSGRPARPRSDR